MKRVQKVQTSELIKFRGAHVGGLHAYSIVSGEKGCNAIFLKDDGNLLIVYDKTASEGRLALTLVKEKCVAYVLVDEQVPDFIENVLGDNYSDNRYITPPFVPSSIKTDQKKVSNKKPLDEKAKQK